MKKAMENLTLFVKNNFKICTDEEIFGQTRI